MKLVFFDDFKLGVVKDGLVVYEQKSEKQNQRRRNES